MNPIAKITLATLLGASTLSGCGKPYQELPKTEVFSVVGTPVSRVERSQETAHTTGSYTFFINISSPENMRGLRCAYRSSTDTGISDANHGRDLRNQHMEYEAALLNLSRERRVPIEFEAGGYTDDKCIVILTQPKEPNSGYQR